MKLDLRSPAARARSADLRREPTQEEVDLHMTDAIERIWQLHPQLRSPAGGLREGDFEDRLICAMVVWLAEGGADVLRARRLGAGARTSGQE